jgi:DNA-binding MarR family transcriptional regulator
MITNGDIQQHDARDVDFQLWRLLDSTRYMIFRSRELELARLGLTPEQAFTLDILQSSGGSSTINQIVSMTQRQHNSISTLVDRMARQGMVRKTRSRKDRRTLRVSLTEKGHDLFVKIPRDSIKNAFSCLEDKEKNVLTAYLDRVQAGIYASIGIKSPYSAQAVEAHQN